MIPAANKGRASIYFFYSGDKYLSTIGLETQRLALHMEKYMFKVLLKLDTVPSKWDMAEKDKNLALYIFVRMTRLFWYVSG